MGGVCPREGLEKNIDGPMALGASFILLLRLASSFFALFGKFLSNEDASALTGQTQSHHSSSSVS